MREDFTPADLIFLKGIGISPKIKEAPLLVTNNGITCSFCGTHLDEEGVCGCQRQHYR